MLVYVRHGATSLNKGGSEERLRGWLPVPLSPDGEQQARITGTRLARMVPTPTTFRASDLNRTMQTANIIGQAIGATPTPDPSVRDWNTGKMAGQKVVDMLPDMQRMIKNPDEVAPGGESMNDYRTRFEPLMRQLVAAPGVHLVVGHARGASLIQGMASTGGGDTPIKYLLDKPTVEPGHILIVGNDWNMNIDKPGSEQDSN